MQSLETHARAHRQLF